MKNEERRAALAEAREQALDWARRAQETFPMCPYEDNRHYIEMASMWARVADAMKVGSESADNA